MGLPEVPFDATEELVADLADGRSIVVAMPGVRVTDELLHGLGVAIGDVRPAEGAAPATAAPEKASPRTTKKAAPKS